MDNDIIPIDQLPNDDVIPVNQLPQGQPQQKSLLDAWGMNMSPDQQQQHPYAQAAEKTLQQSIVQPAMSFLNQAGLNAPRSLANTMGKDGGYSFPQETSFGENPAAATLQRGAGVAGAIFSPVTKLITSLLGGANVTAANTPLSQRIGYGALSGAGVGAAYSPTNNIADMGQRTKQMAVGGALGGATGAVAGGIIKGTEVVKQWKAGVNEADRELLKVNEQLNKAQEETGAVLPKDIPRKITESAEEEVSPLKEDIGSEQEKISAEKIKVSEAEKQRQLDLDAIRKEKAEAVGLKRDKIKLTQDYRDTQLKDTTNTIKTNIQNMKDTLVKSARKGSSWIKEQLPRFCRDASKSFGQEVDRIGEDLSSRGESITASERYDIAQSTLNELDELGIKSGNARYRIEQIAQRTNPGKTEPSLFGEVRTGGVDPNTPTALRDFISEAKDVTRGISDAKWSGAKTFTDEEIAGTLYRKNFVEFLSDRVPEYRQLQQDYRPVISVMKQARRIWEPFEEFSTAKGEQLLSKFGMGQGYGKMNPETTEMFLSRLEQGSPKFTQGIGDVTTEVSDIGGQIKSEQAKFQPQLQSIRDQADKELSNIENEFRDRLSSLEDRKEALGGRKEYTPGASEGKIKAIQTEIDNINLKKETKISEIRDWLSKQEKFMQQKAGLIKQRNDAIKIGGAILTAAGLGSGVVGLGKKALGH